MMRTTLLKNRRERRAMYFQKKTFTLNTFAFKSINLKDDDDDHYDDDPHMWGMSLTDGHAPSQPANSFSTDRTCS